MERSGRGHTSKPYSRRILSGKSRARSCFSSFWPHAMSTVEGNETLERLLEPRDSERFVDRMVGLFAEIDNRPVKVLCLETVGLPGRDDPDEVSDAPSARKVSGRSRRVSQEARHPP